MALKFSVFVNSIDTIIHREFIPVSVVFNSFLIANRVTSLRRVGETFGLFQDSFNVLY